MKRWLILVGFMVVLSPVCASAQEFWVQGLDEGGSFQLGLYSGTTPATVRPASRSKHVSVLVHLASLTPTDWGLVQARIRNLVSATRQAGGLDVYVVADTGVRSFLHSKNAGQLLAELKRLTPPSSTVSAESAWSEIGESFPQAAEASELLIVFASPGEIEDASLRNYASAYLPHRARSRGVRVFHWATPQGLESSSWKGLYDFTCGSALPLNFDVKNLPALSAQACSEVEYSSPSLSPGVFPFVAHFIDVTTATEIRSVPLLAVGKDWPPIRIDRYQEMLQAFSNAEAALGANDGAGVVASLQTTLQINPLHTPALRLGADLYKRQQDWDTALKLLSPLSEVMPADATLWAEIGDLNFNLKRWGPGETAYRRSAEANSAQPQVFERLSMIRENLDDLAGAESLLSRVLELTPDRSDIHVKRGDLLVRLNRAADAAKSFEEALKLDPQLDEVRMRLMTIYKDLGAIADIRRHLQNRMNDVPPDAELRLKYAHLAVAAGLSEEAASYFTRTLEVDRASEPAYFGKADALVKMGRGSDALNVANDGLRAAPSVRLHLLKFDILDNEGLLAEARAAIEAAHVLDAQDPEVLRRFSRMMDIYGKDAGAAYFQLAETLAEDGPAGDERERALERGLAVSTRDGEGDAERSIRKALSEMGESPESRAVSAAPEGLTIVPGGVRGLASALNIRGDVPPASFVLEYAQALVRIIQNNKQEVQKQIDSLKLYFETLDKLKKKMTSDQTGLDTVLDSGRQGFDKTQEILNLLGWRMDRQRNRIVVQVGTDSDEAERQIFSTGFSIDFLGVKQALENGKTFTLHIPYESVPIAFDEPFWLEKAMDMNGKPSGGLCEALIDHLPAARLYIAMASITAETRQQLLKNVSAERLARKYSDYLTFYGSSLSVIGGEVEVPGGKAAASVWEKLAGASPSQPDVFLNTLLEKNNGRLLAYFHTLFLLPMKNQRFFTRTPQRLNAFYKAFPFSEKDILEHHLLIHRNTQFFDLLRELPLDEDGNILFPGSDQVWIVANGTGGNEAQISRMLNRARKIVPPDIEDEILLNLLNKNYTVDSISRNQSENFLAVVRIEKHWTEPMDEATALILAQNYGIYHSLYPYFSELPAMGSKELVTFFKAARSIEHVNSDHVDAVVGEFHGVLSLIALLSQTGALKASDSIAVLTSFCDGFTGAKEPADFVGVTLSTLQQIIKSTPGSPSDTADDRLLNALAGVPSETTFQAGETTWTVNRSEWQQKRIRGVLTAQTATPMQVLLALFDNILAIKNGAANLQPIVKTLADDSTKLLEIAPSGEDHLTDQDRQHLIAARPREIAKIVAELNKEAARKNPKSLPRLATDFLDELIPYVKTTLTAWIYAYYSAPDDLVIAEDKYFVRRHAYYSKLDRNFWTETEIRNSNDTSGLYLHGGLAQVAIAAGQWGQGKADAAESVKAEPAAETAARAQLAAIRSVPWMKVSTEALHLAGVQIRAGREIVVAAATDESLRALVTERLMGSVGNFRRHVISQALSENDAQSALELLSTSDLYFLADMMKDALKDWKSPNPLIQEFQKQQRSAVWTEVNYLGGYHLRTYGCIEPHLVALGPYEEFELLLQKDAMSERLSDLLLNLAESADRDALPSDAVAILAESVLRQVARNTKMVDNDDWHTAILAMKQIDLPKLLPGLEKVLQ